MTKYPYYTLSYFNGGILHKFLKGKKFKSCKECYIAFKKYKDTHARGNNRQFLLIEYSGQYAAKIIQILHEDNDAIHYITTPLI